MAATADPSIDALNQRLDRLEGKLDALTDSLAALSHFSQLATLMGEAAGDGASWAWHQAEARGIDPLATGQDGVELLLRLADPKQMTMVNTLLDTAEDIDPVQLKKVLGATTALLENPDFHTVLDATPQVLEVVAPATTALVEVSKASPGPVGPFGVLGALMDDGVKKATGFALAIAKKVGAGL